MSAITSFLDRLGFAATCIVGWAIFPILIAVGFAALLIYALLAECFSTEEATAFELESARTLIPVPRNTHSP